MNQKVGKDFSKRTDANIKRHIRNQANHSFRKVRFYLWETTKNETLKQFHADLVELASRAVGGDRQEEWFWPMFKAHISNDKITEELLAETKSPQDAYEYAIRRGISQVGSKTRYIQQFD